MAFAEYHYNHPTWWKEANVYQIWPMSYKDSNGDGVGDIPGIISTLDYLKSLGVDCIWLSPMYDSPQKDYGYDISDYQGIYPPFGTIEDMKQLLKECKARGIRLILDLVINHTSDQHKWFLESKKDKTNEKADWYIWKDPKMINGKRHPPNNWRAIFGGSAWEYVEERDQYYLHLFVVEQPDLNWENEITRKAIYKEAIEFWLDMGIDGFRVDTVNLYSKHTDYPDAPVQVPHDEFQTANMYYAHGPRIHEFLQEQSREVLSKYKDVVMVGEAAGGDNEEVLRYTSAKRNELSCIFDFDVVSLGGRHNGPVKKHQTWRYTLPDFKEAFEKVQKLIQTTDAWGTVFLENHDQPRSVSRFVTEDPRYEAKAAKMLAVLLATLSGTLFLYQGQEIGTTNFSRDWTIEDIRDIDSLNSYAEVKELYGDDPMWNKKAMRGIQHVGRDNARLPVQWSAESPNAGFTTPDAKPWIRVHDDYKTINVADQLADRSSPLNFWKSALALRKEYPDLCIFGGFEVHDRLDIDTFTFVKVGKPISASPVADANANGNANETGSGSGRNREMLIICNFTATEQPWDIPPRLKARELKLVLANVDDVGKYLTPYEARVYVSLE